MTRELEERLVRFSASIIGFIESINKSEAGLNLRKQISRSGTSAAMNYAEALGGESRKDFIHKLNIVIKELRETHMALKIIDRAQLSSRNEDTLELMSECNELISIFVKSVQTAKSNTLK